MLSKETAVISHDSVVYALSQAGLSSENMARMDVVEIGCGEFQHSRLHDVLLVPPVQMYPRHQIDHGLIILGGGAVTQHLAKSFKTIHAIDTSPSMLLTFSKNLPVNNPNITYSLHFISPDSADTFAKREPMFSPTNDQTLGGNERKIPPPRARFDLAVANLVVHHIDDLDSFTRGVVGLLNPGGWVVLTEFGKREGEETDGLYTRVGKVSTGRLHIDHKQRVSVGRWLGRMVSHWMTDRVIGRRPWISP